MTSALIGVALVLILTGMVTAMYRHSAVRMVIVAPLWGIAISAGVLAWQYVRDDADTRAHDTCVAKVERSAGNRAQWTYLIAVLQRELPNRPDLADDLLDALNANLPELELASC